MNSAYFGTKTVHHMVYHVMPVNCLVYTPGILGTLQCKDKTLHLVLCMEVHVAGVVVLPVLYTYVVAILLQTTKSATP